MEDLFQVGVITAPHGVRGEVKVFPTTDDNARFKNLKTVLLDQGRGTRELEIEGVKFFKNMVILKFKGIDDRNDVERMRQAKLLVTRENAVELGKDEYFIADLIGIQVVSDEGEELGTISDVLQTGANDVYVVSKDGAKDLLIPAIHAFCDHDDCCWTDQQKNKLGNDLLYGLAAHCISLYQYYLEQSTSRFCH